MPRLFNNYKVFISFILRHVLNTHVFAAIKVYEHAIYYQINIYTNCIILWNTILESLMFTFHYYSPSFNISFCYFLQLRFFVCATLHNSQHNVAIMLQTNINNKYLQTKLHASTATAFIVNLRYTSSNNNNNIKYFV